MAGLMGTVTRRRSERKKRTTPERTKMVSGPGGEKSRGGEEDQRGWESTLDKTQRGVALRKEGGIEGDSPTRGGQQKGKRRRGQRLAGTR